MGLAVAIPVAGVSGYSIAPGGDRQQAVAGPIMASAEEAADFAASEAEFSHPKGTDGFVRAAALSTMNLVQANISAPRYAELAERGAAPTDADGDWAWEKLAGICAGASDAYTSVMDELGVKTRRLEIYWITPDGQKNSHATVETWWGGKWHWLDPTWGVTLTVPGDPTEVLSFKEARSTDSKEVRLNASDLTWIEHQIEGPYNLVGFVDWPDEKVLWFPVDQPSSEIPEEVDGLERLTAGEWRGPLPR